MELPSAAGFRNRPQIHSPKLEETRDQPQEDALRQVAPWRNIGAPQITSWETHGTPLNPLVLKVSKLIFPTINCHFMGKKKHIFREPPFE